MNQPSSPDRNLDEQLHQARLRTSRYWYEDGLAELCVGGLFVLIGLYFAAAGAIPRHGPRAVALGILFPLLVIGGVLGVRRLIGKVKERLVYPRTGYVSYGQPSKRLRWLTPILAAIISALIVALVKRAPTLESWIPALQGLLVGGIFFWMGNRVGVARLTLLAFVSALLGLVLSLAGVTDSTAGAVFYGIVGLMMAAGGTIALRRYLRLAPPPAENP